MSAAFILELTEVRPLHKGDPVRDERTHPEVVLESIPVDGPTAAYTLFTAFCGLGPVRQGRQRPKLVLLSGLDTSARPTAWKAPLITGHAHALAGGR